MRLRFSWFGAALIVIGLAMVLHRLGTVSFEWPTVLWTLVAVAGVLKLVQGFMDRKRGSVFWGTIFFAVGASVVVDRAELVIIPSYFIPSFFVVAIGIGFLLMFLVAPREWHVLIPALVFLSIGTAMVLAEVGYLREWDVKEIIHTYWPVALILFGGSLLLSRQSAH